MILFGQVTLFLIGLSMVISYFYEAFLYAPLIYSIIIFLGLGIEHKLQYKFLIFLIACLLMSTFYFEQTRLILLLFGPFVMLSSFFPELNRGVKEKEKEHTTERIAIKDLFIIERKIVDPHTSLVLKYIGDKKLSFEKLEDYCNAHKESLNRIKVECEKDKDIIVILDA